MHPAAIVGIIVGGIVCIWGGYEVGTHLFDWISCRREQREYEKFVRDYEEKQVLLQQDSDDDDDQPLTHSSHYLSSSSSMIRQRNSKQIIDKEDDNELLQHRANSLMGFVAHDDMEEKHTTTPPPPPPMQSSSPPLVSPENASSPLNNLMVAVPSRDHTPSDTSSTSKTSWEHARLTDSDEDVPSSLDGSSFGILSLSSSSNDDDHDNNLRLRT